MHGSFARAQMQYDHQEHPDCYAKVEPSQRELYESLWKAVTDAGNRSTPTGVCEVLGGPALTYEASSIDLAFQFERGSAVDLVVLCRAMANAAEMWLKEHQQRLD